METTLTDVRDLTIEQAGVLWCLRVWVVGRLVGRSASGKIERMAAQLDTAEAGHFLEGFMEAINGGAVRSLEIGCIGCTKLGADERLLLDALGLAQERRPFEALLALRHLVAPDAARTAIQNAEGAGLALARMGRFLPAAEASDGVLALFDWTLPPPVA